MEIADGPRVAEIHANVFGHVGNSEEEIREAYSPSFLSELLDHRYAEHSAPPLVFEQVGTIAGFVLCLCRPAIFNGENIWVSSTSHLGVDPEYRSSLAAVHLLRAIADGPQDMTYIDRSNMSGRKAEQAAGFTAIPEYSLRWTRMLRPGEAATNRLADAAGKPVLRNVGPFIERALPKPMRSQLAAPIPPRPPALAVETLTLDHVVSTGHSLLPEFDLHPVLDDPDHVQHEWDQLDRLQSSSRILRHVLLSKRGDVVGWYIVSISPFGWAEVMQFVAKRPAQRMAMISLIHDLAESEATRVSGHLPPWLLYDIEGLGCKITAHESTVAVHSHTLELLPAFANNKVWLSALEGETVMSPLTAR